MRQCSPGKDFRCGRWRLALVLVLAFAFWGWRSPREKLVAGEVGPVTLQRPNL